MSVIGVSSAAPAGVASDSAVAAGVKASLAAGDRTAACERYGELVERHQRRAFRLAYYYLRDAADADEAVQDAFVKAFAHVQSFNEELSFEVWFTRILVNGCLDRVKSNGRRRRWLVNLPDVEAPSDPLGAGVAKLNADSPEERVLKQERRRRLRGFIGRLPDRQRLVVSLCHLDGRSAREVSEVTGLSESTVRVHLFRGLRRLRRHLESADPV